MSKKYVLGLVLLTSLIGFAGFGLALGRLVRVELENELQQVEAMTAPVEKCIACVQTRFSWRCLSVCQEAINSRGPQPWEVIGLVQ